MRHHLLRHKFVVHIPEILEPGVLYVSMEYGMAAHSCCCGCGEEVTTPITPTDWKLTYDGESISLNPSVGNWNLACRSHYVIRDGKVIEAGPWSDEQVAAERQSDRHEIDEHVHGQVPFAARPRMAFSVTRTDDPDMAIAAISGVATPRIATGTAIAL